MNTLFVLMNAQFALMTDPFALMTDPFALSLSKGPFTLGFDKLSPNGS